MLTPDQVRSFAFAAAMAKEAKFGEKATEGVVKTIGGVSKKLVDGKWVDHVADAGGGILGKLKGLMGGAAQAASSKPIVRSVNVAKARMLKSAGTGAAAELDWVKEGKNRIAKAIDAAMAGASTANNPLQTANRIAGLKNLQDRTKPAAKAVAGRFKDVHETIKKMPKLKGAALSLLREKRI